MSSDKLGTSTSSYWRSSRASPCRRTYGANALVPNSSRPAQLTLHRFGVLAADEELVKGSIMETYPQPSRRVVMDDSERLSEGLRLNRSYDPANGEPPGPARAGELQPMNLVDHVFEHFH